MPTPWHDIKPQLKALLAMAETFSVSLNRTQIKLAISQLRVKEDHKRDLRRRAKERAKALKSDERFTKRRR
jgi:hypothetical protein